MTSGNLEADFVAHGESHVSFHIILSIWQEETFATVLIAYASLLTSSQFSSDCPCDSFFTQYLVIREYYAKVYSNLL